MPTEDMPVFLHSTRVVPEPQNGSRTLPQRALSWNSVMSDETRWSENPNLIRYQA